MLATTIRSPPSLHDFTTLAEYQSRTPESFSHGKPVLHFHLPDAIATVPKSQCDILAVFPPDTPAAPSINGETEQIVKQHVQVFVHSENFTIFSETAGSGVSIPYPSISIHAVKQVRTPDDTNTPAIWMQLEFSDGGADDDDFSTVDLTIVPPASADAQSLYDAISSCSNLHPDPANDDDDEAADEHDRIVFESSAEGETLEGFTGVLRGTTDGGLPPPMPGSGGWITAENVHEHFDEEGNWIGANGEAGELGEGAGRSRPRHEMDGAGVNGDDESETKRPRVE